MRHLFDRTTFLARFSVLGLVMTLAVGSGVAFIVSRGLTDLELEQAAADAAYHVDGVVAPVVRGQRLDRPLSDPIRDRLLLDLRRLLREDVFRVKIWSIDGTLLFSDDDASVGLSFPGGEVDRAARGETVAHVEDMGREAETALDAAVGRALEVYTPIRFAAGGEVVGVYEIYQTMEALEGRIGALRARVWAGSLVGFLALYASLFLLARGASRALVAQNATIGRRLRETLLLNRIILAASSEVSPSQVMAVVCRELEETYGFECEMREGSGGAVPHDGDSPSSGDRVLAPLRAGGREVGILVLESPGSGTVDDQTRRVIDGVAAATSSALEKASLLRDLAHSNDELRRAYDATIEGLARALDKRDEETEGHSRRVTELTTRMLKAMGMTDEEVTHGRRGALLHDIGKLGIPDSVLLKPGRLDDEERAVMMTHTTLAYEMLSPIEHLRPALDIPFLHHERWDGAGYPLGLSREEIPAAARAFALVDVWDALSSDRPYRKAWPQDRVIQYLVDSAGSHFDPVLVPLFLRVVDEYVAASGLPTERGRGAGRVSVAPV